MRYMARRVSILARYLRRTHFIFVIIFTFLHKAQGFEKIEYEAYKEPDSYKCGQFIESAINDPAMRLFHKFNNDVIRLLSRPFPHEKLLTKEALRGNVTELQDAVEKRYMQWVDFERNWLAIAAALAFLSAGFTIVYFFYRCCVCCCSTQKGYGKKVKISEKRYDNCQRILLDILISIFIIVNLFASVVLLMSTQYAQYGIEQLPTRLNYCVNDLSVYKFENYERIRKLLRDDFQLLNSTLVKNFDGLGAEVLTKFKRDTGANLIYELVNKVNKVEPLLGEYALGSEDLERTQTLKQVLAHKLSKLRESEPSLRKCAGSAADDVPQPQPHIQNSNGKEDEMSPQADSTSARICRNALQLIQPLINYENFDSGPDYGRTILPPQISNSLHEISALNIVGKLRPATSSLDRLQLEIQSKVNSRRGEVISRLKDLDDTMFRLFEDISNGIKSIDLKRVEELVDPMMQQRERLKTYIQYSWIMTLIITGIFMFIAFSFLLGLFYGCCGRRPSIYNDDCCVRSTGSKFYACGIWLCMAFMAFFAVISVVLMFVGANASNLICHPLEDPLSRPDMLSFVDRMLNAYEMDDSAHLARYGLPQILSAERRPADLIRGCQRGITFYTMLGLDRKFKLLDGGGPVDEYLELSEAVKAFGIGRAFVPDDMNFFNSDTEQAIQQLATIRLPLLNASTIQEFRATSTHFETDAVLHQLKKVLAERPSSASSSAGSDANAGVAEVTVIARYLEDLRDETHLVLSRIDDGAQRLTRIASAIETVASLSGGDSTLAAKLRHVDATLNAQPRVNELLDAAASEVADDLTVIIKQYAQHVNDTMQKEVSSCEPIRQIARNTRAAICDYTLDPFNGVWMAMMISLLFMIPIIILSTRLTSLYGRVDPLHNFMRQYQAAPTTTTDSIIDVDGNGYGRAGYYGIGEPAAPKPLHYGNANGLLNNDDYFNYQQFPPPYGGHPGRS